MALNSLTSKEEYVIKVHRGTEQPLLGSTTTSTSPGRTSVGAATRRCSRRRANLTPVADGRRSTIATRLARHPGRPRRPARGNPVRQLHGPPGARIHGRTADREEQWRVRQFAVDPVCAGRSGATQGPEAVRTRTAGARICSAAGCDIHRYGDSISRSARRTRRMGAGSGRMRLRRSCRRGGEKSLHRAIARCKLQADAAGIQPHAARVGCNPWWGGTCS